MTSHTLFGRQKVVDFNQHLQKVEPQWRVDDATTFEGHQTRVRLAEESDRRDTTALANDHCQWHDDASKSRVSCALVFFQNTVYWKRCNRIVASCNGVTLAIQRRYKQTQLAFRQIKRAHVDVLAVVIHSIVIAYVENHWPNVRQTNTQTLSSDVLKRCNRTRQHVTHCRKDVERKNRFSPTPIAHQHLREHKTMLYKPMCSSPYMTMRNTQWQFQFECTGAQRTNKR